MSQISWKFPGNLRSLGRKRFLEICEVCAGTLCFGGPRVYPITRYSGPGGLAAGLSSPLARSHNERPLSAANSATLLAMRAAHSMVPAATLRPDE